MGSKLKVGDRVIHIVYGMYGIVTRVGTGCFYVSWEDGTSDYYGPFAFSSVICRA